MGAIGFGDHHRHLARARRRDRRLGAGCGGAVERAPLVQHAHRLVGLVGERCLGLAVARPRHRHDLDGADGGRRRGLAPRSCSEVGRGEATDALGRHRGAPRRIDLARVDQPFRARQDRGELDFGLEPAVVVLAARVHERAFDREVANAAEEREIAQLRELGSDLAGIGVDRIATGQDEVERARVGEHGRERLRGGEGVGAGEGRVGDEHTVDLDRALDAPRDGLAQRVLRRRRPEGDDGDLRTGPGLRELDRLTHRAPAVRVELELDAVALEPPVRAEVHLLEPRHLLHQHRDPHAPRLRPAPAHAHNCWETYPRLAPFPRTTVGRVIGGG